VEWTLVHQAIRPIYCVLLRLRVQRMPRNAGYIIHSRATRSRFLTTPALPASLLFPFYSPWWNGMVSPRLANQVAEGSAQLLGTGPMSYMISLWQDQTSLMASGVPMPAPRGSPAGPNLDFTVGWKCYVAIYNSCISTCNRACQVGFGSWLTSGSVERQWSSLEFQRTLFR